MLDSRKYDCVVIGGGHNGLVAAAYLARAGKSVCVVERRHVLGGAACTEETWPGYKISTAAYVISLFLPQIIHDLRLADYGLAILPRNPSSFTPLPDGRSLLMGPRMDQNQLAIGKFSALDADAYPRYEALLERIAGTLEPLLMRRAPHLLPLPRSWRRLGIVQQLGDLADLWRMRTALGRLGEDLPEAIELLAGPARPILDRWFEADVLKAALATDAVIGAMTSISSPGSAYVLLHHVMGEAGGARGIWGYVRGGMGGLATALEGALRDLKVTVLREAPVRSISVSAGRARGVVLEDGRAIDASAVASSVDAHLTFEKFLTPEVLPEAFRKAVGRIDYSSASAKINLALSEPPRFRAADAPGLGPHHRGTMHIAPSMDYIEQAYDDAKYGRPSQNPILEMTLPTSVDDSLAPPGRHVMNIFVQYAPYQLAEGDWDSRKEAFADRCLDVLAEFAPNVHSSVIHRQILSPRDLESTFGLTGGNIFQGAMSPWQLFSFRPVPGWADHRTPVAGLFLCGAASHPGGGVMGACGRNAAHEILRDL